MSEHEPRTEQPDDLWTDDMAIGEGRFYNERFTIHLKLHEELEHYSRAGDPEIIPIRQPRGQPLYFLAKPYILEPDIRLTMNLYPYPTPGDQGAVGEVASSNWEGMKQREIGSAQGWYYSEEGMLVLWEVLLDRPFRLHSQALEDTNLQTIWRGFESVLLGRCKGAKTVVTPFDEPMYERDDWQAFLRAHGYHSITQSALGK